MLSPASRPPTPPTALSQSSSVVHPARSYILNRRSRPCWSPASPAMRPKADAPPVRPTVPSQPSVARARAQPAQLCVPKADAPPVRPTVLSQSSLARPCPASPAARPKADAVPAQPSLARLRPASPAVCPEADTSPVWPTAPSQSRFARARARPAQPLVLKRTHCSPSPSRSAHVIHSACAPAPSQPSC
ncbi:hypothetical protein DENSPDRAFT_929729 [Dentipellis sp. KUC8613]|nr:hypothetical protein DENSPDRAFT_929729 [Dentipellis sp. KUC8613]